MKKISVLIVDDSALIRRLLSEILSGFDDIHVIGTATDPFDAREKIKALNPDVVTLDIEMPKMDGLSFLEKIMTLRPTPVVMVSTLTQNGADATLRALETGAVDYIAKPANGDIASRISDLRDEFATKIRMAAQANISKAVTKVTEKVIPLSFTASMPDVVIAMGSSTGGVEALRDIFSMLPAGCPPIVMTQHMPAQFTPSLAKRLDSVSQLSVKEAVNGDVLQSGHAYLAPGSAHMRVVRRGGRYVCVLDHSELVSGHRPSVDVLFSSVAEAVGEHAIGIILTGMGKDGANGLLSMRNAGARTIGQNASSCVVYGMPRAAFEVGAVERQAALNDIPREIISMLREARS